MMNFKLFGLSTLCLCSQTLFAQMPMRTDIYPIVTLNNTTVSANKIEQAATESTKDITVIDAKTIAANAHLSVAQLLNQQAGIFISGANNTLGTNPTVYFQGATAGNTLILIDGMPVYDGSNISSEFDINFLNLQQIQRIEILKGSQSTTYGSDAVAGVINIITNKASDKKIAANGMVSYGSFNTSKVSLNLSGTQKKWSYQVQNSFVQSDGFSTARDTMDYQQSRIVSAPYQNNGFKQLNNYASLNYQFSSKNYIKVFAQMSNYKANLDAGAFTDERDYTLNNTNRQMGIKSHWAIKKADAQINYMYGYLERAYTNDSSYIGSPWSNYENSKYKSYTDFMEAFVNLPIGKHIKWILGFDYRGVKTNQYYFSSTSLGPYESQLGDSATTTQQSMYSSLLLNFYPVNFDLGIRSNNHSVYGANTTYNIGMNWSLDQHFKLVANYATGFKVPSLYQLYGEFGNKLLKPEQTKSFEMGLKWNHKSNAAKALLFVRNTNDLINFFTMSVSPYTSFYINTDQQKAHGLELEYAQQVNQAIKFSLNYTYVTGTLESKSDFTQKDTSYFNLFRRPKHMFNALIQWHADDKLDICLNAKVAAKQLEPMYMAAAKEVPGYAVFNLSASYKVNEHFSTFALWSNLLNTKYYEVWGYNTAPTNIQVGIRFQ
ncbi:MAG: TonB-dependent receptor [Chitinophagia bacterium]|nr:TonB-dependent receptor [Chitinophagia bacterium]